MNEITQALEQIQNGEPSAAEELLPLVYDELRKLAAGHMANEAPGHTLDATALVHEAYLRLVSSPGSAFAQVQFAGRAHFFAAASEAMRRILVDCARRKQAQKRGTDAKQFPLDPDRFVAPVVDADRWIDLDEALTAFEKVDAEAAELAKLRIFGGLSVEEAGEALEMPRATAFRVWTYARAWLSAALADRPKNY
jgi:RNA polymerase sigma factor (TIGR02999 family)